jgi:hypothetical protein
LTGFVPNPISIPLTKATGCLYAQDVKEPESWEMSAKYPFPSSALHLDSRLWYSHACVLSLGIFLSLLNNLLPPTGVRTDVDRYRKACPLSSSMVPCTPHLPPGIFNSKCFFFLYPKTRSLRDINRHKQLKGAETPSSTCLRDAKMTDMKM